MCKFNLKAALTVGALALSCMLVPTGSALAEGAWCAEQGGRGGYSNCGYHTFRQCLAAISGVGGHCKPNPNVVTYEVEDEYGRRIYRRYYH
ncbi:MAG TPA: DUF3551 domain-containing protein [Xanthobacteraceae bacterium]|nr:DUF3551 domain-containing protein [Xanthobacteraceae bacterium]